MDMPEELDLFENSRSNVYYSKVQYVEHRPINPLNTGGPICFLINPSAHQYIDISQTRLYVKFKIVKGDGSNPAADELVAPVNLPFHSMFSQAEVWMQQQLMSSAQLYPYKSYIETLLKYNKGEKNSYLQTQGWARDTPDCMDTFDVKLTKPLENNEGFLWRYGLVKEGKEVELEGPLLLDIFTAKKALLNGVELSLKLWPSRNSFLLCHKSGTADYKIIFQDVVLKLFKTTPLPDIVLAHNQALQNAPAVYPIQKTEMKVFQIPAHQTTFSFEDVYLSRVPNEIILGFVTAAAFNGNYNKNPFNFKHFDLSTISTQVDDISLPSRPLQLNFANNLSLEGYETLFDEVSDKELSPHDYSRGYALYRFPLVKQKDKRAPYTHGNVKITGRFRSPVTESLILVAYARYNERFTIDQSRNIQI